MRRMRESFLNPKTRDGQVLIGAIVLAGVGLFLIRSWKNSPAKPEEITATSTTGETADTDAPSDDLLAQANGDSPMGEGGIANRSLASSAANLRTGVDAQGNCTAVEYPGRGPASRGWSDSEWKKIGEFFQGTKTQLEGWIGKESAAFTERARTIMKQQLTALKIERPASDEPDLAWRGIVIWNYDSSGNPVIRVGAGFRDLMTNHPQRARFEMARAMVHGWSPCEMVRLNTPQPWVKTLTCLGVDPNVKCGPGSYSDAAWAVSTTVAAAVANPGCQIPAFKNGKEACVTGSFAELRNSKANGSRVATRGDSVKSTQAGAIRTGARQ